MSVKHRERERDGEREGVRESERESERERERHRVLCHYLQQRSWFIVHGEGYD